MSDNDDYELAEWEEGGSPAEAGNTGTAAIEIIGKVFEYAREKTITKREIERYHAMRDVAITEITERYKFAHALMNKTIAQRRMIIEKQFEVIDKGLETHNYELVNMGLEHITAIAKDNPFKLFQVTTAPQRKKMLEDGDFSVE